jgi:ketosteroid isomerase-like protein
MSATTAQDNLSIVREWYDHVLAGELEEAAAMMADDFVLHEPPGLPYGGEYHGPQGFFEVMQKITALFEPSLAKPLEYLDAGNPVIIKLVGRFRSHATGEVVEMDIVELYYVRDGKIAELDGYYKDPAAIAAAAGV